MRVFLMLLIKLLGHLSFTFGCFCF